MKKLHCLYFLIIFQSNHLLLAQGIANSSFESEIGTTITGWSDNGSGTESVGTTNPRTGNNALSYVTSSTTNQDMRSTTSISVPNNDYVHIIGWAVGNNANSRASIGTVMGTLNTSTTIQTIGTTLTQLTFSGQNTQGSTQSAIVKLNSRTVTGSTTLYWDDIVIYSSSNATADLISPNPPTSASIFSQSPSQIVFSWINGSDANSGLGTSYILRTTNTGAPDPIMNNQGKYSTSGGASGPNSVGADWTVIGTATSSQTNFTDGTVSSGSTYKYAIIHSDMALNYSSPEFVTGTALPIELISFRSLLSNNVINLTWQTASELNNDYFLVEHSKDGKEFIPIGKIPGGGTTAANRHYSFIDKAPSEGINYYRLKQVDYDATFTYSHIVSANFSNIKGINIYPTIVEREIKVDFFDNFTDNVVARVFDMTGRLMNSWQLSADRIEHTIDLSGLNQGAYYLQLNSPAYQKTVKFLKL